MKKFNSIKTKTYLYFLSVIILVLAVFWITKPLVLETIYSNKKTSELATNSTKIVEIYEHYEQPEEAIQKLSLEYGYDVVIFRIEDNVGKILFDNSSFHNTDKLNISLNKMLDYLGTSTEVTFVAQPYDNFKTLTVGKRTIIDNETTYFYISTPLAYSGSIESATSTWILISSICILAVCLFIAALFTNRITSPIEKLRLGLAESRMTQSPLEIDEDAFNEIQEIEEMISSDESNNDSYSSLNLLNIMAEEISLSTTKQKEAISNLTSSKSISKKTATNLQTIYRESSKVDNFLEDLIESNHLFFDRSQLEYKQFDISSSLSLLCQEVEMSLPENIKDFSSTIAKNIVICADEQKLIYAIKCALLSFAELSPVEKLKLRFSKVASSEIYKLSIKTQFAPNVKANLQSLQFSKQASLKLHTMEQIFKKHNIEYSIDYKNIELAIAFTGRNAKQIKKENIKPNIETNEE